MINRLVSFLQESRQELKRVNWPTWTETRHLTLVVIGISLGIAIFLGVLDTIFLYILGMVI